MSKRQIRTDKPHGWPLPQWNGWSRDLLCFQNFWSGSKKGHQLLFWREASKERCGFESSFANLIVAQKPAIEQKKFDVWLQRKRTQYTLSSPRTKIAQIIHAIRSALFTNRKLHAKTDTCNMVRFLFG
jgi:hypothetical protein